MLLDVHYVLDRCRLVADEVLTAARRTMRRPQRAHSERPLQLSRLEDRVLFSAAPIPGMTEATQVAVDAAHTAPVESSTAASDVSTAVAVQQSRASDVQHRTELVFIDSAAQDYQQLLEDLLSSSDQHRDLQVFLLDESLDGINQISAVLDDYDRIDAIHIVSHATEGRVQLGGAWLSEDSLSGYAGDLASWANVLSDEADLMFYGCDLAGGPSGQTLIDSLAALTGADVAASDDDTGHESLGGDWELEFHVGEVETGVAFSADVQQDWVGLLPTATISDRETIDNDGNGQIDHIRISVDAILNDDFSDLVMTVAGYSLDAVTPYITDLGGGVPDNIFYIRLVESGTPDTGATPVVQLVSNTQLLAGGNVVGTDAGVAAVDKAAPVIVSADVIGGATQLTITFSEAVDTSNVGVGDLLDTDFNYVDVSTSGVASISSMGGDADGTDNVITLTLDAAAIAADGADTISAAAAEIYDLADNAANPIPVSVSVHTLTTTGASTVQAGELFTLNLGYTGPATITSWTVNWGDGNIETFAGNPASVTHTYTNAGFTNNILVSASDGTNTYRQNHLHVARSDNDSVEWFGPAGGPIGEFGPNAGLDYPTGMIVGPDGNTYVSGWNSGNVVRYSASGVFIDEFVNDVGMTSAAGLAFGPDGNLYVASYNSDEIRRYDATTGNLIDVFVAAGSGGLDTPTGIEFGPDGDLYVASYSGDAVFRYNGTTGDPWNGQTAIWVPAGTAGIDAPSGIAFGPNGDLFVSSEWSDEILRFHAADGTPVGNGEFVTGVPQVNGPLGIEFGPDGDLYISNIANDSVVRVDGATGAYIEEFILPGSGGLNAPDLFTFLPGHQVTITAPPTIIARDTVDLDGDGFIDAIHITFDKAIQDATVNAGDWDVAGVGGEAFSSTTNGDTADDADIYITFTDGVLDTGAQPSVVYTQNATADLAGNLLAGDDATAWWDTDWLNRNKITFDNSNSAENLTDFPVLIRLTAADIDFSKIKADGADIRFVDDDGTALAYEIESWDDVGETANIWVRVQQIDQASSTDFIYLYYNNTRASDAQNAAGVWNASYEGVWHLGETGNGTADEFGDSSGTGNNGQGGSGTGSMTPAQTLGGRIGSGQDFDGTDDFIDVGESQWDGSPAGNSYEFWFHREGNGVVGAAGVEFVLGKGAGNTQGFGFGVNQADGAFVARTNSTNAVSGLTVTDDTWYHVVVVATASDFNFYVNGVFDSTVAYTYAGDNNVELTIGKGSGNHFDGLIDELRISSVARSADWIEASYLSQLGGFAFASIGGQQAGTADDAAPVVLSRTTADLDGDGFIDAVQITFNEAILDSTVNAGDWDVAGVTGEAFASNTAGDTADDADIYITFADGVLDTSATPGVTYTQGTLTDHTGNPLSSSGPVAATDATAPRIIAKETADLDGDGYIDAIHVIFSEAIQDATVSAGDWDVAGVGGEAFSSTTNGDTANDADIYITFTDGVLDTGATPDVTYTQGTLADANGQLVVSDGTDAWWDGGWLRRKKITFDNSNSAENLIDFPLLVALDSSNIDFSKIKAGGADIRFIDHDGTVLNYEIESWDDVGETASVWVRVQQVDQSSSTDYIHLYYDNAAASDGQNATGVWPAGFAVYHLGDDPGPGGAGDIKDSDSTPLNGTAEASMTTADLVAGRIGSAIDFDSVDDFLDFATTDFGDTFTISAWIRPDSTTVFNSTIVANSNSGATTDGFRLFIGTSGQLVFETGTGVASDTAETANNLINFDQWNHVAVDVDRASGLATIYHNGVDVTLDPTIRNDFNTNSDWHVGNMQEGVQRFDGAIDELRIANTDRSADWIEASFLSQNGSFAFTTLGSEEVGTVDKAAAVLLSATTPNANGSNILQAVGEQLDLVFSESLGGTISEADLEAALTFAAGATDGDNLPAIGSGVNPIALVTTVNTNDTIRVTLNTNNTANTDLLLVGTHTVQVTNGTNLADAAGNAANTSVAAVTISNAGNLAPVLDATGTMSLTDINEDDTNSAGNTVQSIIDSAGGDRITDANSGALEGIAVIDVHDFNGTWQYDAGSGWTAFGAVSNNSAVLLNPSAKIRFVPDANYNGSAGNITFRAWDQTSGSNGQTGVDVSTNGGATAFSTATEVASLNVNSVNDIPTLTTLTNPVDTTNEDVEVEISFADLTTAGDESDPDGTVDAFVVKAVSSGTLKIGATAGTATAWVAGTNDTIDASKNAYWTPDSEVYGTQNAFTVVAEDDGGAESSTALTAQVNVNPINDHSPVADSESFTVQQGATATNADLNAGTTLLDGDTDADLPNDTLTVNTTPVVGPGSGTLVLNSDGTFSYTHNGGLAATDSFIYEVIDGVGNTDTATVTITITPTFIPPPPPPPPPIEGPGPGETEPPVDEATEEPGDEPGDETTDEETTDEETNDDDTNVDDGPSESGGDAFAAQGPRNGFGQRLTVGSGGGLIMGDESVANGDAKLVGTSSSGSASEQRARAKSNARSVVVESTGVESVVVGGGFLAQPSFAPEFLEGFDEMRQEVGQDELFHQAMLGSSLAVTTSLSVGYVIWLIRGGVLLSSMLSSLPAWQMVDPLPVLGYLDDDVLSDTDDDSLETLVNKSNATEEAPG